MVSPLDTYCEEIKKYGIEFDNIPSKLSDFLNCTEEQIFIFISPCKTTRLSAIKVIQALKGMDKYKANASFISMYLSSLWSTLHLVKSTFESKGTLNLLVVECENEIKYDKQKLFETLSSVVEKRSEKKIIFITRENDPLAEEFKNNLTENVNWSEETDEKNSLTDLKQSSLEKLWMREIFEFQEGEKCVSINALASKKLEYSLQKALEGDLLFSLIENSKNIKIGKAPKDLKYDTAKDFFISRTFSRYDYVHKKIEQEESKFCVIHQKQDNIKLDPQARKDIIVISDTDEKFNECCSKYANNNIHWLKQKGDNYVWQQSKGSTSELHKFLVEDDTRKTETEPNNIMDVPDKVVLIAAEPGMGKSVILSRLAINTQFISSHIWILRCNLKDYSEELYKWKKECDVEEAIKFLYKITEFSCQKNFVKFDFSYVQSTGKVDLKCDILKTMKLSSLCLFEIQLFTHFLNQRNIALLLDGFDEIIPFYEEIVIKLIEVLKCHTKKIWLASRPLNAQERAENLFGTFSYKLDPFTHADQRIFLEKFWKKELEIVELDAQRSEAYINELLRMFSDNTKDFQRKFGGFPLQMYMIAKIFSNLFKKFYESKNQELTEEDKKELKEKLNLNLLYEDFIKEKYHEEQRKSDPGYDHNMYTVENIIKNEKGYRKFLNVHRKLAVWTTLRLRGEREKFLLKITAEKIGSLIDKLVKGKIKSGLCVIDKNNKPNFIHLTFAEYFTADYIWEEFKIVDSTNIVGFIYNIMIEELVWNFKQQICAFLISKAQKDFESKDFVDSKKKLETLCNQNFVHPNEKLETLIKILIQESGTEIIVSDAFYILCGIIEPLLKNYEVEITRITENFRDAPRNFLLNICARHRYEELTKALVTNNTNNKESLRRFLKDQSWSDTFLQTAIEEDHLNIANLFTELYDMSIIKDTLENFIDTILRGSSVKFLEYLSRTNIFEIGKPYTLNNKENLLLFNAFESFFTSNKIKDNHLLFEDNEHYSISDRVKVIKSLYTNFQCDFYCTSDKITFLIDKTDINVIDKFIDFYGWDIVIGRWSLFLLKRGIVEVIMHAMKKRINFSNVVNIILYECITFPVNYTSPKRVEHCLKMIQLLFGSGASYNCKNIYINIPAKYRTLNNQELDLNNFLHDRKCELTTLQYSKQIYLTYKILNKMMKLFDKEKCETYCSLNKIFKLIIINYGKCDNLIGFKVNSECCLIPCFKPESPPMKTWKEITLPSFRFMFNCSPIHDDIGEMRNTLVELHSLINEFRDIIPNYFNTDNPCMADQYEILVPKLDRLKNHLLNEVVILSKANDISIDDAFNKISKEVQVIIELQNRAEEVRSRSQDETFLLTTDIILSIWETENETTNNDALQNVTSEIIESSDIHVVCNALTSLLNNFIIELRMPENLSNLENESKRFYQLLKYLDELYNNLTSAIITKNCEEIKTIMEKHPTYKLSIIHGQDEKFGSPLHYVASQGDVETAELLLLNGANPNLRLYETGIPELLSTFKNSEVRGGEDWPIDYYSWTPLHLAALNGCNEIVQHLINAGARIDVQLITMPETICKGDTPLHVSIRKNHLKTAQVLLQNGACYDVKNSQNKTPLELTKSGSDVADLLQCIHQLFQAVGECRKYSVCSLLEKNELDSLKAILHAKNSDNHTLLNIAQANEHEEMVDLLRKDIEIP